MLVTSRDYEIELAAGRIAGGSIIIKSGRNSDIDAASAPEDIWDGGGVYTGFPTGSAETVTVVSSSANDTAAGSGARTVQLIGLNSEWLPTTETVTLNGTTPVTSTNSYRRITRVVVRTSGSSNAAFNAGTITVAHSSTTANVFCVMPIGSNQNQCAVYTVPAGKTGFLRHIHMDLDKSATAYVECALWIRELGQSPRYGYNFTASDAISHERLFYGGLVLPAKTDITVRVQTASANNLDIYTDFDLILLNT